MVETNDWQWIYSLRKEECIQLLTALEPDTTGSVPTLRVLLWGLAKYAKATQIEIFKEHKVKFEDRKDKQIFRKYTECLPFAECHEVLVDFKGEIDAPEYDQRKALIEALNETTGEVRDGRLAIAANTGEEVH